MKEVEIREALKDLSKFMREVYCWCDQDGSYTTGMVSLSRGTVRSMRRLVDAVLEADSKGEKVKLMDGFDSAYMQLFAERSKR